MKIEDRKKLRDANLDLLRAVADIEKVRNSIDDVQSEVYAEYDSMNADDQESPYGLYLENLHTKLNSLIKELSEVIDIGIDFNSEVDTIIRVDHWTMKFIK